MAQGKKVLLIDDDEDFRDALVEQLSIIEGFEVFEDGDAAETLAIIKNTEFDLLILDIGLPDADVKRTL